MSVTLDSFAGKSKVLGKEATVKFAPAAEAVPGSPQQVQQTTVLAIFGLTVSEAQRVLGVLENVEAGGSADKPVAPLTSVPGGKGKKELTVVVQDADGKEKTVQVPREEANGATAPAAAAAKPAKAAKPAAAPAKPAKEEKPAPAAKDELDEDDEDAEEADELDEDEDGEIPVDDTLKTADKASLVFRHLVSKGLDSADKLLAYCKKHQAEIPALAKVTALEERVKRAAEVLLTNQAAS